MTSVERENPLAGEIDGRQGRADQQEHQRIGEKRGEFPELEHERASMRSERDAKPLLLGENAQIAHRHPGGDARQHAGGAEMFGDQKRAEGGDRGQRRLDEMILGGSHDHDGDQPDAEPGREPAASNSDKRCDDRERVLSAHRAMGRPDENEGEEDRGRAIVEQALGLDEEAEAAGHSRFFDERDDRDRVGRADQRPENEGGFERPAEQGHQSACHDDGAERDPDRRQRNHRNKIASQIAPAQVERRLEQERRQDDVEDEVVGQRQAGMAARGGERCAGQHEADRIGQTQAARRERDQNREAKQAQRAKQQNVHASCLAARLGKRNRAVALFRRGEIGAGAQIALGIDRLAVDAHFVVQMRAGRAAGRTEPA